MWLSFFCHLQCDIWHTSWGKYCRNINVQTLTFIIWIIYSPSVSIKVVFIELNDKSLQKDLSDIFIKKSQHKNHLGSLSLGRSPVTWKMLITIILTSKKFYNQWIKWSRFLLIWLHLNMFYPSNTQGLLWTSMKTGYYWSPYCIPIRFILENERIHLT